MNENEFLHRVDRHLLGISMFVCVCVCEMELLNGAIHAFGCIIRGEEML